MCQEVTSEPHCYLYFFCQGGLVLESWDPPEAEIVYSQVKVSDKSCRNLCSILFNPELPSMAHCPEAQVECLQNSKAPLVTLQCDTGHFVRLCTTLGDLAS